MLANAIIKEEYTIVTNNEAVEHLQNTPCASFESAMYQKINHASGWSSAI